MEHREHKLSAVMFTDIVGFSKMMEKDERGTLELMSYHDELVRTLVQTHRGTVIKTIGDAFMVTFSSCLDAVLCAVEIQERLKLYNQGRVSHRLNLRIGLHLGDIYFYENDALGEGINIASRLQSISRPGRVTVSREVFSQVSGKIPLRMISMGQVPLKNISREVYAYEILLEGDDEQELADIGGASRTYEDPGVKTPLPPSSHVGFGEALGVLKREFLGLKEDLKAKFKAGGTSEVVRELSSWFQGKSAGSPFSTSQARKPVPAGPQLSAFQRYKAKVLRYSSHGGRGFLSHLFSYAGVNAGLLYLNFATSSYPWAFYPIMGWGIGLATHGVNALLDKKKKSELERFDDLDDESFKALKSYQNTRSGFWSHLVSNAMVSGLLWGINFMHGSFLWSLIPIAALAVGVLGHLGGYLGQRREGKALLKGVPPQVNKKTPEGDPLVQKAQDLRQSIVVQLDKMPDAQSLKSELIPTMDQYVKQIGELRKISLEIDQVLALTPADWETEERTLMSSLALAKNQTLKVEYQKSLDDLSKQKKSYEELRDQNEIIGLRINSSLKGLRQVQIDLARLKGVSDGTGPAISQQLRSRTEEMTRYVEDFHQGLKDLE